MKSRQTSIQIRLAGGARFERRQRCKNGRIIHVEISVNYQPTSDAQLFCFLRDISERKRTEESLRVSEDKYRKLHESMMDAFVSVDMDGRIMDYNHAYISMVGFEDEEIKSLTYKDITPEKWHAMEALIVENQVLTRGYSDIYEKEYRRKDGTVVPVELRTILVRNSAGSPIFMWAIVREISSRKQAELALDESKQRLELACRAAGAGTWDWDITRHRLNWSRELYTLFGLDPLGVEATFDTWMHVLHPDDRAKASYRIDQAIKEKIPLKSEYRIIHPDGHVRWIISLGNTTYDASDQPVRMAGICIDITERIQLENNLRQSQKMEAIGQLAGGVAHDFNNNMAATILQLNFLKMNTSLDSEAQQILNELMAGAKRSTSLTAQLLMFSRRSVLEIKVLDLNEVVANLLKMLSRLIGEQISLRFDRGEALPAVEADAHMIEQVVMNLAVNARDAMPKGGLLTIRLESVQIDAQRAKGKSEVQPGLFVCLSVADTGCGMNEATLKHIFEPFFTTKEIGKGTGLGLATIDGIVAQHKGWVDVESDLGKGTTFKVFLPAIAHGSAEQETIEKIAVSRGHETILLVEDDLSLRRVVAQGLRLLGYRVLEADNGQTAIKLWPEHGQQIDLLFSDMVMPEGMTGVDLTDLLKKKKPDLKVIISSGYNVDLAGHSSQTIGGIVYLQKPYEFDVLSKAVRDCLDRTTGR